MELAIQKPLRKQPPGNAREHLIAALPVTERRLTLSGVLTSVRA